MKKVVAPFRLDRLAGKKAARADSGALNALLRWFKNEIGEGRSTTEIPLQLLEEGLTKVSDTSNAHTRTPDETKVSSTSDAHTQTREWTVRFGTSDADTQTMDLAAIQLPQGSSNASMQALDKNFSLSTSRELDAQTVLSDHDFTSMNDNGHDPRSELPLGPLGVAVDEEASEPIQYPTENQVAVVNGLVSFLITRETIDDLHEIIIASHSLKRTQMEFEKAEVEVKMGQIFAKNAEAQINDPELPEQLRNEIKQDLELRKPIILRDSQRKAELEHELSLQACNLKYLRQQVDNMYEQMMTDAGVIEPYQETPDIESDNEDTGAFDEQWTPSQEPQGEPDDAEPVTILPDRSEASSVALYDFDGRLDEENTVREECDQALENLRVAKARFNDREAAYQRDIAEHADGVEHSREEIDLFHVQLGAELTKDLREAEEEYEDSGTS